MYYVCMYLLPRMLDSLALQYSRYYVSFIHLTRHSLICQKNEDVIFSSLATIQLHLTSIFKEMNTIAPTKSCAYSLPARSEFKATSFLLCVKKLPRKSFGILVASVNGKKCPQPRAPGVCDFKELSIREQIVDRP